MTLRTKLAVVGIVAVIAAVAALCFRKPAAETQTPWLRRLRCLWPATTRTTASATATSAAAAAASAAPQGVPLPADAAAALAASVYLPSKRLARFRQIDSVAPAVAAGVQARGRQFCRGWRRSCAEAQGAPPLPALRKPLQLRRQTQEPTRAGHSIAAPRPERPPQGRPASWMAASIHLVGDDGDAPPAWPSSTGTQENLKSRDPPPPPPPPPYDKMKLRHKNDFYEQRVIVLDAFKGPS